MKSAVLLSLLAAAFGASACGLIAEEPKTEATGTPTAPPSTPPARSNPDAPVTKAPPPTPTETPTGPRAIVATSTDVLAAYADGVHRYSPDLTQETLLATGDFRMVKVDAGFAYLAGPSGIDRAKLPSGALEPVARHVSWEFEVADGAVYTAQYTGGMESSTGPCEIFSTPATGGVRTTVYSRSDCQQVFRFFPMKGVLYVSDFDEVQRVPLFTDPLIPSVQLPKGSHVRQLLSVGASVSALSFVATEATSTMWSLSSPPTALSNGIVERVDDVQTAGSRILVCTRSADWTRAAIRILDPQSRTLSAPVVEQTLSSSDRLIWAGTETAVYVATSVQPLTRVPLP